MNRLRNTALAGVGAGLVLVGGCAETANAPKTEGTPPIEITAALYVAQHGYRYPWGMGSASGEVCTWSPENPQPWQDARHALIVGSCALSPEGGERPDEQPVHAYSTLAEARAGARPAFSLTVGQLVGVECYTLLWSGDGNVEQTGDPEVWVLVSTEEGQQGVVRASAIGHGIPRDACSQGMLDRAAGQAP